MSAIVTVPNSGRRLPMFRIAGSVLLVALLVFVLPRHKLGEALSNIRPLTLAAILPLYLAVHFLGCLKWHLMVNEAGAELPLLQSVRCYFAGLFSNLFFPSLVGGDVVSIAAAVSRSRKREGVVAGVLANRILDLIALLLLASLAVIAFPGRLNAVGERLIELILAVLLAGGILACLFVALLGRKFQRRLTAYRDAFVQSWRRPGFALAALGLGLISQISLIALTAWLGAESGVEVSARAWLFAWPLAKLSAFVPVTLSGIGTREVVLAALLTPFGASPASSSATGFAWDAIVICGSLAGGLISKGASLAAPLRPASSKLCVP